MNILQDSRDVLYLSISFGVILLSVLTAWFIYYLAQIVRQIFKITEDMRERMNKIDEVVKLFKEKIEHSASYLFLIGEGIKKLVEIAREYSEKRAEKSGKKAKK